MWQPLTVNQTMWYGKKQCTCTHHVTWTTKYVTINSATFFYQKNYNNNFKTDSHFQLIINQKMRNTLWNQSREIKTRKLPILSNNWIWFVYIKNNVLYWPLEKFSSLKHQSDKMLNEVVTVLFMYSVAARSRYAEITFMLAWTTVVELTN